MAAKDNKPEPVDHKLQLIVVVNGVATEPPISISPDAALTSLIARALAQTQNTGRPPEDWLLKDVTGKELDRTAKPEDYNLRSGATLFLTLKAGVGGNS